MTNFLDPKMTFLPPRKRFGEPEEHNDDLKCDHLGVPHVLVGSIWKCNRCGEPIDNQGE